MNHLIAVLVFAAACVLLFAVQHWAGGDGEAACDECDQPGCPQRETGEPGSEPPAPHRET